MPWYSVTCIDGADKPPNRTTVAPEQDQIEDPERANSTPNSQAESQTQITSQTQQVYFTVDVGDDERVKRWPSFMGMSADGKAVIQLTQTISHEDDEFSRRGS